MQSTSQHHSAWPEIPQHSNKTRAQEWYAQKQQRISDKQRDKPDDAFDERAFAELRDDVRLFERLGDLRRRAVLALSTALPSSHCVRQTHHHTRRTKRDATASAP
jgi:hypothetical protein